MIKSVLTCCRVVACLLLPTFFNSALALDAPPHDTLTYTLELKPIPYEAFNLARVTFLPEVKDSEFGFSGNELDGDYNHNNGGGDCSKKDNLYTPANCLYPYGVVSSSQCAFLPGYYTQCKCLTKFNKTSCDAPYILGGESCEGKYEKCVCPAKVELTCPNDTCTKTCDGNCIAKSCTPTANQTGCTNGTKDCDDGCCGTSRKCCVPCVNKITSKPENSSYTYSSCTDGEGSKQIQTGWSCNSGYHEKNGACEKDCQIDSCSAYPLTSCPENGTCSKCTKTAQDCSTDGTRYKLDSCASGFVVSGNSCREQTCEEKGQKTCNGSCIATSECCGGCASGQKCENGTCVAACTTNSCPGYTMSFCPTTGNCSKCTIVSSNCTTGATKYKLDSCKPGYKISPINSTMCVPICAPIPDDDISKCTNGWEHCYDNCGGIRKCCL